MGIALSVVCLMRLAAVQMPADGQLLVTQLVAREGVEDALAVLTTDLLISELRHLMGTRVSSEKEVRATLELERVRRSAGADVVRNAVDVASALAAPEVVTGTISRVDGAELELTIFRVRTQDSGILATVKRRFSVEHQEVLVEMMPRIAAELMRMQVRLPEKRSAPVSAVAPGNASVDGEGAAPGGFPSSSALKWMGGGLLVGAAGGVVLLAASTMALSGAAALYGFLTPIPVFTSGAWLAIATVGGVGGLALVVAAVLLAGGAGLWGMAWRG